MPQSKLVYSNKCKQVLCEILGTQTAKEIDKNLHIILEKYGTTSILLTFKIYPWNNNIVYVHGRTQRVERDLYPKLSRIVPERKGQQCDTIRYDRHGTTSEMKLKCLAAKTF